DTALSRREQGFDSPWARQLLDFAPPPATDGPAMPTIPIYYINRTARTDRRALIESQMAALGLSAERVEATEGDAVPAAVRERFCDTRRVNFLTPAAAACTTSHLHLWRRLVDEDVPWALILEDDAVLSPLLPAFLAGFSSDVFDIVRLETILRNARVLPERLTVGPIKLRPFRSVTAGSAAYMISRRAMVHLLNPARLDQLYDRAFDLVLYRHFAEPARDLDVVMTDPGLAVQLDKAERTDRSEGDVYLKRDVVHEPSRLLRLRRRLQVMRLGWSNGVDHLAHLPRGLTKRMIPFAGDLSAYRKPKL
ncbi:MAG: glycosyltransferase family 25 protein, partial [Devosia sp.]